jgi:N-acetylneuraminic acid mutarotase
MPTARSTLSTSAVNGKIYAIGGQMGRWGPGGGLAVPIVEEYDPATDTWVRKADMPTARLGLSTSVVNGKIHTIGGLRGTHVVEEYDPSADTWTKKTDMPRPRMDFSTGVVNGKIYAIGGTHTWPIVPVPTVEEYDSGFVPPRESEGVAPKGKLTMQWGRIKSD